MKSRCSLAVVVFLTSFCLCSCNRDTVSKTGAGDPSAAASHSKNTANLANANGTHE